MSKCIKIFISYFSSTSKKKVQKINLIINMRNIPGKTCTKYLGVIIDKHLIWKKHINYLNIKLSNGILTKLRYNLPRRLIKTVYCALFKPDINYCINIWICTAKTNLEPISISMKKAIRIITLVNLMGMLNTFRCITARAVFCFHYTG